MIKTINLLSILFNIEVPFHEMGHAHNLDFLSSNYATLCSLDIIFKDKFRFI